MPFADVNGQKLYYTDSGGDGTAVILSGAMLLDTVILEPLTDALAKAGYRAIAFDARYHGQTKSNGQEFDFIDWARDFIGLADALGIERAIFGGESGGGDGVAARASAGSGAGHRDAAHRSVSGCIRPRGNTGDHSVDEYLDKERPDA